jgi:polyhydroxyalkanoate synthase subunit PhaE
MSNTSKSVPNNGSAMQPFFDQWQTWYEKTCQPFLNIPQFGLTRYYQEHTYQAVDKSCQLQGTLTEFLNLLWQPIQRSFAEAQKEATAPNSKKKEIKEPKDLYSAWLSVLEKQYMELFRSPEYTRCLSKAMLEFNEFMISRQAVMEDLLKTLPVPTNSEMDGLYKEFHELKQRVRDLEKEKVMH